MPFVQTTCNVVKYKNCVRCGREIPYGEKVWLKPKCGYYCRDCYNSLWFVSKRPKTFLDRHPKLRRLGRAIKGFRK